MLHPVIFAHTFYNVKNIVFILSIPVMTLKITLKTFVKLKRLGNYFENIYKEITVIITLIYFFSVVQGHCSHTDQAMQPNMARFGVQQHGTDSNPTTV